jgi:hypothetical protein
MDPKANLAMQDELSVRIRNCRDRQEKRDLIEELNELRAEYRNWTSRGGFSGR